MEKRKANNDEIERRYITHEVRAEGEGENLVIAGTASSYNSLYDMGWFLEQVAPGAVDADTDMAECKCLFNHDVNLVLGSVGGGQLELSHDEGGLYYRNKNVNTTDGRDKYELIRSGAVDKSSFGFSVSKQKWEVMDRAMLDGKVSTATLDRVSYQGKVEVRTIEKIRKLWDVSPVTFPANPNTSTDVAKRSRDAALEKPEEKTKFKSIDADLRLREMALNL